MQLPKPSLLIPCMLLSEMKAVTCCEFSCSQAFQPSSAGWCCAFSAEQVWMPSVGTHWNSLTRSFPHPENGAAAPDTGITPNTSSDNHRVKCQLRMRSNDTEKKFPDCIPTPQSPDTAQPAPCQMAGKELGKQAGVGCSEPTSTAAQGKRKVPSPSAKYGLLHHNHHHLEVWPQVPVSTGAGNGEQSCASQMNALPPGFVISFFIGLSFWIWENVFSKIYVFLNRKREVGKKKNLIYAYSTDQISILQTWMEPYPFDSCQTSDFNSVKLSLQKRWTEAFKAWLRVLNLCKQTHFLLQTSSLCRVALWAQVGQFTKFNIPAIFFNFTVYLAKAVQYHDLKGFLTFLIYRNNSKDP